MPMNIFLKISHIIPKETLGNSWKENAEQDNIKVIIDDAFDVLDSTLALFVPI
jgi:type I restriction enzyme M protein